ncbi:MAG: aspartate-alanine antiporter [Chromatiales bacterium]|nr:aspartate-alanine antiporter [Chromatiales bacterium]
MIDFIVTTLRNNPELAIFLTLGVGYWLGQLRIGKFQLGSVTGVLVAGILIGQLDITISPQVKSIFFIMFLFAVGYGVGPQFVRGIASDGAPQALFAVVVTLLCLLSVYIAAKIQGYDVGFAAGLLAGSQTISASIGLATDAINGLGKSAAETKELLSHIPVAYAVVYLWGTIGTGLILSIIGPKLLGVNIEEECKRYEAEMHGGLPVGSGGTAWRQIEMRAYQLKDGITPVGKSIAEAEAEHSESRIFVEGIRRDGKIIDFDETTVLQAGDVVAASARRDVIVTLGHNHEEVEDRELLDVPAESVDLVLTRKAFNGKTIMELAAEKFARGVYLSKITRGATSVDIPIMPKTTVHRGDILTIVGTRKHTDRVVEAVGYADRPTDATDMVWVGIAIVIGGLIGAITVPVSGVPITLSTSGGALIAGIILGWLRGVHPTFGRVPSGALWIMNSVGLNVFIAVVGISSGPTFVAGLQQVGFGIFFWGIFATSVPMLLAPLIGKYIFKFDPAINLGVCGGARTSTASVAMVGDVAKSSVPMLGYTVPYAVANTTLTLWGLVIVLLIA